MSSPRFVGWLLVLGPLAFAIAACNPYLARAWTAPEERYLTIVGNNPSAWRFSNVFFATGGVVTAAGLLLIPHLLPEGWPSDLAFAGAGGFVIATTLWVITIVFRQTLVASRARRFIEVGADEPWLVPLNELSGGLFQAFMFIGLGALAAVGLAVTGGGPIPEVVGWTTVALSGLLAAGLLAFGDMPPFTIFIAPLAFGISTLLST